MDDITLMMQRRGNVEEAHFSFSYTPVRAEDRSAAGFFCACLETTDRVLSERRRREVEERLRMSLTIKTVGFILWTPDFVIAETNPAFLAMTGFTEREALGRTWQELTQREYWPASEKAIRQREESGEVVPYEKQYFRKDGSRWWGLFAPKKVGYGAMEFVVDITKRKEAEKQAREREERLQLIVDMIPTGLIMMDERGAQEQADADARAVRDSRWQIAQNPRTHARHRDTGEDQAHQEHRAERNVGMPTLAEYQSSGRASPFRRMIRRRLPKSVGRGDPS
jgi:PAS domain S-box-containing protein